MSFECGNIRETFRSAREAGRQALMEIGETIYSAEDGERRDRLLRQVQLAAGTGDTLSFLYRPIIKVHGGHPGDPVLPLGPARRETAGTSIVPAKQE